MIKPGWTHILTLRNGDKRIVLVNRLKNDTHSPRPAAYGEYLVAPPYRSGGRVLGTEYTFMVNLDPDAWEPVCEGRHSNPEELLNPVEPVELPVGTVRIGTATGDRYEVRGAEGGRVWVLNGSADYDTWHREEFLRLTAPAPTFFQDGHDYEKRFAAGGRIRVTVRHVGRMPNGVKYAVAEIRSGMDVGAPALLAAYDFNVFEDVTK